MHCTVGESRREGFCICLPHIIYILKSTPCCKIVSESLNLYMLHVCCVSVLVNTYCVLHTHSPLICVLRAHSPLICVLRAHSPLICVLRAHSPLICVLRAHSPLICVLRVHSPLICVLRAHGVSVTVSVLVIFTVCVVGTFLQSTPTLHGSLILQSLLKFKDPGIIVDSLVNMPPDELVALGSDPCGSHVVEAFMSSVTVPTTKKAELVNLLKVCGCGWV